MDLVSGLVELGILNLIGLAGIVMIGLPHGAYDGAVAIHLGIIKRFSSFVKFMIIYVALAALVVAIWMIAPIISLIIFLTISASESSETMSIIASTLSIVPRSLTGFIERLLAYSSILSFSPLTLSIFLIMKKEKLEILNV